MIKTVVFSIALCSLLYIPTVVNAQSSNIIIYDTKEIRSLFKEKDAKKPGIIMINNAIKDNKIQFELVFDKTQSIYRLKGNLATNDLSQKLAQGYFGGINTYYTDLSTHKNIFQSQAYGDLIIVPTETFHWQLTNESKTIGNYVCYKATTVKVNINEKGSFTRQVTAWYTPKIATNYGPRGYHGLPGLILELQEHNLLFYASAITLNTNVKIIEPTGHQMSAEEFLEFGQKASRETRRK
jgi:GLPGLI family protein